MSDVVCTLWLVAALVDERALSTPRLGLRHVRGGEPMPLSLTIRLFGLELLSIEASTDEAEVEDCSLDGGTLSSTPISFTPSDGRWNPGADFGAGEPED